MVSRSFRTPWKQLLEPSPNRRSRVPSPGSSSVDVVVHIRISGAVFCRGLGLRDAFLRGSADRRAVEAVGPRRRSFRGSRPSCPVCLRLRSRRPVSYGLRAMRCARENEEGSSTARRVFFDRDSSPHGRPGPIRLSVRPVPSATATRQTLSHSGVYALRNDVTTVRSPRNLRLQGAQARFPPQAVSLLCPSRPSQLLP